MVNLSKSFLTILLILVFCTVLFSQNKFQGYSFTVEAGNDGACPIRYLPGANGGNSIDVFIAGTNFQTPATGLTACDGSVSGNRVNAGGLGGWCFQGPEPMYEIKLRTGQTYLWYPLGRETGFINVKDFRPVTRTGGANPQYNFSEPADYTKTIKNAIAFVAARQGGTLRFPDGDYIVGTLDGNTRDPNYQAITLPPGINIVGAGSVASIPGSDFPFRFNPTRIRLRNTNQTIFRIGGCTSQVSVSNLELLGNTALLNEARRDHAGNYGVEAMGKWEKNAKTGVESSNTSQMFSFENVTFQNLDKGIFVHNANDGNCNPNEQICTSWQFDYVKVDKCLFNNNKTGIYIDTYNTDWKISNSVFNYVAANAPGEGIHVKRGGSILVEQSFGGGYDYGSSIGGTFIYIDTMGSLTVINSGAEHGQRSIYTNPAGAISTMMLTIIGCSFGDKVELHSRLNYTSTGNFYAATTIQADPEVRITSINDRFCESPDVTPGRCKDENQRSVKNPTFGGGRVMFQTGRLPEGRGADVIERRPNFFGYDVELNSGLMQFDKNITFKDITAWAAQTDTGVRVSDGALIYCKDCKKDTAGVCTQGTAGADGAFAKRINGKWRCD